MSHTKFQQRPSYLARKLLRARKKPGRLRLRLESYDNSQAIPLERYNAIYLLIQKIASTAIHQDTVSILPQFPGKASRLISANFNTDEKV